MNKFKLVLVALVFGTVTMFASTAKPNVSKEEIKQQVVELVAQADSTISVATTVKVTFAFSTEGEIIVKKIDSKNKEVIAFIRENLNSKKLENPGKIKKDYTMSIELK